MADKIYGNEQDKSALSSVEQQVVIRRVKQSDLAQLIALESASFSSDKLNRRRFQFWIKATHSVFLVVCTGEQLLAYGLVIMRKGTRLARLYSIAVSDQTRGMGIGKKLLLALEEQTLQMGKLFMRLEVAQNNTAALALYKSLGYRIFGSYSKYYEDDIDALRMQKDIKHANSLQCLQDYPYYQQTTDFTCGPAALMMAMAKLDRKAELSQALELDIWREATSIYMTSGHGGCHPVGLALAAKSRGLTPSLYINTHSPLFVEGVRSEHKKQIMLAVEQQFLHKAAEQQIDIQYIDVSLEILQAHLNQGAGVIILISTYQFDGKKSPHWVTVTAIDDLCLYVHDPDLDEDDLQEKDNQHIPICREDFYKMSSFGKERLRTALVIYPSSQGHNR